MKTPMDALRNVVEAKGANYIYKKPDGITCEYEHEGKPSCLVGHALVEMGFDIDFIRAMDDRERPYSDFRSVFVAAEDSVEQDGGGRFADIDQAEVKRFLESFDGASRQAFLEAQAMQDRGHTWGAALVSAEITFARQSRWYSGPSTPPPATG